MSVGEDNDGLEEAVGNGGGGGGGRGAGSAGPSAAARAAAVVRTTAKPLTAVDAILALGDTMTRALSPPPKSSTLSGGGDVDSRRATFNTVVDRADKALVEAWLKGSRISNPHCLLRDDIFGSGGTRLALFADCVLTGLRPSDAAAEFYSTFGVDHHVVPRATVLDLVQAIKVADLRSWS